MAKPRVLTLLLPLPFEALEDFEGGSRRKGASSRTAARSLSRSSSSKVGDGDVTGGTPATRFGAEGIGELVIVLPLPGEELRVICLFRRGSGVLAPPPPREGGLIVAPEGTCALIVGGGGVGAGVNTIGIAVVVPAGTVRSMTVPGGAAAIVIPPAVVTGIPPGVAATCTPALSLLAPAPFPSSWCNSATLICKELAVYARIAALFITTVVMPPGKGLAKGWDCGGGADARPPVGAAKLRMLPVAAIPGRAPAFATPSRKLSRSLAWLALSLSPAFL
mmetsp:Transcript_40214/g.68591  ORF Transcript_40214/g.68591 Transcript_40214/m.68591 type:complete len:277 (-) Transcript_40214:85-915(-)